MGSSFTIRERWLILICAITTILVHLINLGMMPLLADEAIRATVAFEMMERQNYIVPTLWGEFYYRKPPLYNWLIIGFFQLFGSFSEFVFRLPSVIPLFLLGIATWFVSRKHLGDKVGAIAAFGFVLSGRLLTRDSMLGHIDIFFSLTTFMGFYAVFHFYRNKSWWLLFLVSYLLAAAGVLMKGLPSFLFQGFTLLVWFVYKRNWKKLISIEHAAGIGLFLLLVVGYFGLYSQYNSLETYFSELYGQAAMRTVVERKWYEGIVNIFTFPFENLGHLFPTSILVLFSFQKGQIKSWLRNEFTAFTLLVLAVNLIPYWLSPGYYPRYLFMLYPMVFLLMSDAFVRNALSMPRMQKWFDLIIVVLLSIILVASSGALFFQDLHTLPYFFFVMPVTILIAALLLWLWTKWKTERVWLLFGGVILFRLVFDAVVIPYRIAYEDSKPVYRKMQAEKVAALIGAEKVRVFDQTPLDLEFAYYLGVHTSSVIERDQNIRENTFYLVDQYRLEKLPKGEVIYSFESRYEDYVMNLVRWPSEDASR